MTRHIAAGFAVLIVSACVPRTAALTDQLEARRLAAAIHVEFMKAAEASNLAVMSDSDEGSKAAAQQAVSQRNAIAADVQKLRQLLGSLNFAADASILETFAARFEEYQRLDDEILPLAVGNTNLKAQRLSFVQGRAAVADFRAAIAADHSPASARAQIGILEILALEAPHIAEARDDAMTAMEREMSASEQSVRAALAALPPALPAKQMAAAREAFDRFMTIHAEVLRLSRLNTDVRSLALSLGRKQTVTAQCEAELQALEHTLSQHDFRATR